MNEENIKKIVDAMIYIGDQQINLEEIKLLAEDEKGYKFYITLEGLFDIYEKKKNIMGDHRIKKRRNKMNK